jgi:hypothetical protein
MVPARRLPAGQHTFDPDLVGAREARAWAAYYRHQWARLVLASVGLVDAGFGMGRWRTLAGAWHVYRANRHWSPYPDNDPEAAQRSMERFYALVAAAGGVPIDAAHAARLEVRWWHLHRERQHDRLPDDAPLEGALAELYAYAYGVPDAAMREAARWRVQAMHLSDRWVAGGRRRDDPLLDQVRRALVRSYAALQASSAGPGDSPRAALAVSPGPPGRKRALRQAGQRATRHRAEPAASSEYD